ncbi:hypothetical protein [Haliangium sp. UPWRP_2]|uniref:hypothetical protein n=1 Tax=Haliangium sp. UPWRP_2 TaxID=1931276 RepID=UPI0011B1EDAE|nr:hypothetical protein [Haliangium sp. UPWRP_2]
MWRPDWRFGPAKPTGAATVLFYGGLVGVSYSVNLATDVTALGTGVQGQTLAGTPGKPGADD